MNWWKTPLIVTGVFFGITMALAVVLHLQIHKTAPTQEIEDARDEKMGSAVGSIFGAGIAIIWVAAYLQRNKP